MKRKTNSRVIAVALAILTIITTAVPVMAASTNNSIGSKGTDIAVLDDSNFSVEGKDTKQNQKSEYELFTLDGNDIISSVYVYGTVADGSDVYDPENPDADENGFVNGKIQVGVPTTIIIDGKANSEGFYVGEASGKVKGNISGSTVISVVPDDEVTLKSKGKANITASVEQNYTQFVVETSDYSGDKVNKFVTPSFNDKSVFDVSVKTKNLSAGSWSGSFNYNISVVNTATVSLGRRVTSWNISATERDDVWMTYYQPNNKKTAKLSSTSVETFEDGTVVISGAGKMEDNVNRLFYDLEKMSSDTNEHYWQKIKDNLSEEEYNKLVEVIGEGTALFYWVGSSSIGYTDVYKSLYNIDRDAYDIARNSVKYYTKTFAKTSDYMLYNPKKVIIEDGVTNVSARAFSTCTDIATVDLGNTITEIDDSAFINCKGLTELTIPNSVTKIGAFAISGLAPAADITIPASVTEIGQDAFTNNGGKIYCAKQWQADKINADFDNQRAGLKATVIVKD